MTDAKPCTRPGCPSNGHPHTGCTAHNRAGKPCTRRPMTDQHVCDMHGGKSPRALAAVAQRAATTAAGRELRKLFPDPTDPALPRVDPTTALLDLIAWKHAEVLALRERTATLDDDLDDVTGESSLVWGRTRVKEGGDDRGTTEEAKPNIWWVMLRSAEDQLASFAAAAHRAGIADQQIRLAQGQVQLAMDVIRDALGLALAAVAALLGDQADQLRAAWPGISQQVIVQALQTRAARLEQDGAAS